MPERVVSPQVRVIFFIGSKLKINTCQNSTRTDLK